MIILPIVLILDLLIPFVLAPTYKGYNHLIQVMSVLGNSKAPLHNVYNIWLVVFGIFLVIIDFKIYSIVSEHSNIIATLLFIILMIYAIGGCILSGLFPVGEIKMPVYYFRKNTRLCFCHRFYVFKLCTAFSRNLFIQN